MQALKSPTFAPLGKLSPVFPNSYFDNHVENCWLPLCLSLITDSFNLLSTLPAYKKIIKTGNLHKAFCPSRVSLYEHLASEHLCKVLIFFFGTTLVPKQPTTSFRDQQGNCPLLAAGSVGCTVTLKDIASGSSAALAWQILRSILTLKLSSHAFLYAPTPIYLCDSANLIFFFSMAHFFT